MAENYGLPYTGSKSRIAHWVIDNLPCGRVLIDAFAGGCSITHRALLSPKWQTVIANDMNGKYPKPTSGRHRASPSAGVQFGRPIIPPPSNWAETIESLEHGEITQTQAADSLNMPLSTFRYRLNKCKE